MTSERVCACGCGESMAGRSPRAMYASDACRARGWKARTGYGRPAARKVRANGRAQRKRTPDLRISFRKAVEAVNAALASYVMAKGVDADAARLEIEDALAEALTARQREALSRVRARDGHVTGGGFRA